MKGRGGAFAAWLALAACAPGKPAPSGAPSAQPRHATVFVSAELKGYLGPCGCSENMRGGIARAAHQLALARSDGAAVAYVDSGDALFSEATIPEEAVPQQERKARAMAEALTRMGLSFRAAGPLDDARGAAFRAALKLPELPASGVGTLALPRGKVAVVAADGAAELADRGRAARAAGAKFVLGLWRTSLEVALQQAPALAGAVDLALAVKAKDELAGEQNRLVRGAVPLAQLQTKGRSLLKLELYFDGAGAFEHLRGADDAERELAVLDQRIEILRTQVNEPMLAAQLLALRRAKLDELIARREALAEAPPLVPKDQNAFTVRFVPLESSFAEDAQARAIVTAYDREVGLLNLAWAKQHGKSCPPPGPGQAAFVGNAPCFECHDDAFKSWNASKHSRGYQTLEQAGKQHHLDCVGCHLTGWQQPGGVCRVDQTRGREGIGCESCHGPGSAHSDDPTTDNVLKGDAKDGCTTCHDRENSPHFDHQRYLKEVLAPGHGLPVVKPPRP